jgi:hypothetical protein
MSEAANHNLDMLGHVADGLGEELLKEVAFVGGATTWLLCTDDAVLDDIRYTEDVDLVIELAGIADWQELTERLATKGFKITREDSDYTCRFRFQELIVDVMPSIPEILGYANRWFVDGLAQAEQFQLPAGPRIQIFKPTYFLATKLEAFRGRGGGTAYHKDFEDILVLVDGREELLQEVRLAKPELRSYIAQGMTELIGLKTASYAIESSSSVRTNPGRGKLIFDRFKALADLS